MSIPSKESRSPGPGPLSWMARNPVAANLLMLVLIFGGFISLRKLKQEVFPEFALDQVSAWVTYPGSGPEEIEQGILLAIEQAVQGLDGIKDISSRATEGFGIVTMELVSNSNSAVVLADVKNEIDQIQSFPQAANRPTVRLEQSRNQVMSLVVSGDHTPKTLRQYAETIRDELLQRDGVTQVMLLGVEPPRIAIEVPEHHLRAHSLTLRQIAQTISSTALELPGGSVKGQAGDILLRTQERRDYAEGFLDVPVISNESGAIVTLRDIAQVTETFEEVDTEAFFNNKPAVRMLVFRVGNETPMSVATEVRDYLSEAQARFPDSINVTVLTDRSIEYSERIGLLQRNAALGLLLVLALLGLFLEPRLAFWVTLGIPVSVIGSFLVLNLTGASLNMISLFAFIATLGIVVDDAIMVGENIYGLREQGTASLHAAIAGARQIAGPVVFAVLTNVAAFMPLLFVPGAEGNLFCQIPAVAVSVLLLSLLESLFILPAHLSNPGSNTTFIRFLSAPQHRLNVILKKGIERYYAPLVQTTTRYRIITLSTGVSLLLLCLGIVGGGFIRFTFLPQIDQDASLAQVVLPFGAPFERSQAVRQHLTSAAQRALRNLGASESARGVFSRVGESFDEFPPPTGGDGSHVVNAWVSFHSLAKRNFSASEFTKAWRTEIGDVIGAEEVSLTSEVAGLGGPDIEIDLNHPRRELLEMAAQDLAIAMGQYKELSEINDGVSQGKSQLSFKIKREAQSMGIDSLYLANTIRDSFYGAEALRQQRDRNEVRVLVRLPESDRQSLHSLENLTIVTPKGGEIPLKEAAEIFENRSYTTIHRHNGRRIIRVTAALKDDAKTSANDIVAALRSDALPSLQARYPGLVYTLEGEQRRQSDSLSSLASGYALALLVIYGLLAIPFKSYIQPVIIMIAIPFGIVGALFGHLVMGYNLSMISLFGIVALSGVVLNDSLVLVVTANRECRGGSLPFDAICRAGMRRFRPIMLTSLTTFFGLLPMIFESSAQARFLIPMAISLGFGILFSTVIVLLLVPAAFMIVEDTKQLLGATKPKKNAA